MGKSPAASVPFFKGGRSVSATQPMDVHDVQPKNESQMVGEHDRSTKLEDLNVKDWPLEDSFKPVSNFLDSMPSNSQDTEPERSIRTPSPSSVSSSKRSLHETSIQIYQKQDQQLEDLEQQMDELSAFLEQTTLRREKLLARALAQMQSINAEVQIHLRNADINISNCVESEQLTPPTKDMGVDPTPLVTTTMSIADTLPEYHAGDNGLRERNLYSSDTKNERISISPSTSLLQNSLSNAHFPGTKSLISTTKLLPKLLKDSFEPLLLNVGYRILFRWTRQSLSIGCLVVQLKLDQLVIDVVDHRAQTLSTHGKKFCCPFMMDVAVAVHHAKFYHGRFDRRDIGVAVL